MGSPISRPVSRPAIKAAKGAAARTTGVLLALSLAVALAPGAAVAAFSGSKHAAAGYSAATLLAPASHPTNITMTCFPAARSVTVKNFGQVAHANYHELKIFVDSDPVPIYTGELKKQGQTVLQIALGTGAWRAEITGQYKVPGSTNVWTGPPYIKYLHC